MDWPAIGSWAGDDGPYIAIIFAQWGIIWRLLDRFFGLHAVVIKALDLARRSADVVAETIVSPETRP